MACSAVTPRVVQSRWCRCRDPAFPSTADTCSQEVYRRKPWPYTGSSMITLGSTRSGAERDRHVTIGNSRAPGPLTRQRQLVDPRVRSASSRIQEHGHPVPGSRTPLIEFRKPRIRNEHEVRSFPAYDRHALAISGVRWSSTPAGRRGSLEARKHEL